MSDSKSLHNCTGPQETQPDCQPFVFYSFRYYITAFAMKPTPFLVQDFLDILNWNRTPPNTMLFFPPFYLNNAEMIRRYLLMIYINMVFAAF